MSTLASTTKESEWDSQKKRRDVCEFMAFNDRISKSQCPHIYPLQWYFFLLTSGSSECTSSSKDGKGGNIEHRLDRRVQLLTHARCRWHWASAPKRSKDNRWGSKKSYACSRLERECWEHDMKLLRSQLIQWHGVQAIFRYHGMYYFYFFQHLIVNCDYLIIVYS